MAYPVSLSSMQKFFCALVLFLMMGSCSDHRDEKILDRGNKILFLLTDSSTMHMFEKVMEQLDAEKKDYSILALGVAADLLKGHPRLIQLPIQKISPDTWPRLKPMSDHDIQVIRNFIMRDSDVGVVMSGLSFFLQAQVLRNLEGIQRVFFYDPLTLLSGDYRFILNEFFKIKGKTILLVTTKEMKQEILNLAHNQEVHVVGQPSLSTWIDAKKEASGDVIQKLGSQYNPAKQTILYIGSFERNDNFYKKSLTLFFRAVVGKDINIVISTHPQVDGEVERSLFKEMKNVTVISSRHMKPEHIAYSVNNPIIVTQRSIVAVQAHFAAVPVIYLDAEFNGYTNFLIKSGDVPQCFTEREFQAAFERAQNKGTRDAPEDPFVKYDIPQDSTKRVLKIALAE